MYTQDKRMIIAWSGQDPLCLEGRMANRHGLVAGATGTGKTVSLQVLAETFSAAGVPCFMADVKGDLSGISQPGKVTDFIAERADEFGLKSNDVTFAGCPTRFFDVFGEKGHPLRTTISDMGPLLLARTLDLNETQTAILNVIFHIADAEGLLLIDTKDLRLMLDYVSKNAKTLGSIYGNMPPQSIAAIQRSLTMLNSQGGDYFFGEPAFNCLDLIKQENGRGVVNLLAADKLLQNPLLYSSFLLWLLSELYTHLPEVGDMQLPKLVFFFDEAHTLFKGTPKVLVDKVEQVVRLVRSKGVGVYFVTQIPGDIPDAVLGQLGNRIQHALRAFTPKDQKLVRAAAETFRANPDLDTAEAIMQLATGEAIVSFLDEQGAPSIAKKAKVMFPFSSIGPVTDDVRNTIIRTSPLFDVYNKTVDRESAYEVLTDRNEREAEEETEKNTDTGRKGTRSSRRGSSLGNTIMKTAEREALQQIFGRRTRKGAASSFGASIIRGILGSIFRK
ncbi:MAG: DUF853 family protein [Planctomycetia bacterium]|nr:DUF853 family protein [Planctomycetia bacterium]